jgi:hypothetical protein
MWIKVTDYGKVLGALVQDAGTKEWLFIAVEEDSDVYGKEFDVCGEFGGTVTVTVLPEASRGLGFEVVDGKIKFSDELIVKLREL